MNTSSTTSNKLSLQSIQTHANMNILPTLSNELNFQSLNALLSATHPNVVNNTHDNVPFIQIIPTMSSQNITPNTNNNVPNTQSISSNQLLPIASFNSQPLGPLLRPIPPASEAKSTHDDEMQVLEDDEKQVVEDDGDDIDKNLKILDKLIAEIEAQRQQSSSNGNSRMTWGKLLNLALSPIQFVGINVNEHNMRIQQLLQDCEFNPHTACPVEPLHMIKLGLIKHQLACTLSVLCNTQAAKDQFCAVWDGIDNRLFLPKIKGKDLLEHHKGFVGADHFTVAQMIVPVLYHMHIHLTQPSLFKLWVTLCQITMMCYSRQSTTPIFVKQFSDLIEQYCKSVIETMPALLSKHKLHQLLHAPYCIAQFGMLLNCVSEMFESKHKFLREDLTATNRQNVGRDVLKVHNSFRIMKHIMDGGFSHLSEAEKKDIEEFAIPILIPRESSDDEIGKVQLQHKEQKPHTNNLLRMHPHYNEILEKHIEFVSPIDGVIMYNQVTVNNNNNSSSRASIGNWIEYNWEHQNHVGCVKMIVKLEFSVSAPQSAVIVQVAAKTPIQSLSIDHFSLTQNYVAIISSHVTKVLHAEHACDATCTIKDKTVTVKHMGLFKQTKAKRVHHSNSNCFFINPFVFNM